MLKREIGRVEKAEEPFNEFMTRCETDLLGLRSLISKAKGNRHAEARLARKMGTSRSELPNIETGIREAIKQLKVIEEDLNCELATLRASYEDILRGERMAEKAKEFRESGGAG